jgi:hypothetical protein
MRLRRGPAIPTLVVACAALAALVVASSPSQALETFDFEARYLVHRGNQIWDFCLVPSGDQYHVFYHTIPPVYTSPAYADTIWHALSTDLRHWEILGPALTSGPDWWDAEAIWAPDVVYDEQSERWAMLYTGVADRMVQRACLAWSDDMTTWTKAAENPVFEPDSLVYHWAPSMNWSSFRDPFVYRDDGQWNMLSTAGLRDGSNQGGRRGIIHRAVSDDLIHWTDAGVFFAHDGEEGSSRDLESAQYIQRGSWHHLFFVEQELSAPTLPTSLVSAHDRDDWTMADRVVIDEGWAPEVEYVGGTWFDTIFGRLYQYDDPRDNTSYIVARFDLMSFGWGGGSPWISLWDPLYFDWPDRFGEVGDAVPAFGDNPVLRDEPTSGLEGHGWFSSYEYFGGPLSGIGEPGAFMGEAATGGLTSRSFVITGNYLRLLVAGGLYPETCYVSLVDAYSGEELRRIGGQGHVTLTPQYWNVQEYHGRNVELRIVDDETGPDGWIAVDSIRELDSVVPVEDDRPGETVSLAPELVSGVGAFPNPFNGGTEIRFELRNESRFRVEVFDLTGRLVWRSAEQTARPGEVRVPWDARDVAGRPVPSGVYLLGVTPDGGKTSFGRLTYVE